MEAVLGIEIEIEKIEVRLAESGRTVGQLCEEAGIARSTWQRWKSRVTAPNWVSFEAVREACERLAPERDNAA